MSSEKVLITGSEGFIGKYVCEALEREGYEIIRFDKRLNPNDDLLFSDLSVVKEVEYVIHLAALVGLNHCYENPVNAVYQNIIATTRLLEACRKHGVKKFIHTSTWAVKGNLTNPYDLTKLAAENMVNSYHKLHNLPITILRLGTAYGRGMSKLGVIPTFLKLAKENKPLVIHGRGEQIRQFTHVRDLAQAFIKTLTNETDGKTYYIVTKEVTTIKQIAEAMGGFIEHSVGRAYDENYEAIDPREAWIDLDWQAKIKLNDGIKEMREIDN